MMEEELADDKKDEAAVEPTPEKEEPKTQ